MRIFFCLILVLSLISCTESSLDRNTKSILLVTDLNPAFIEPSEFIIEINDSVKKAIVIIAENPRGKPDTQNGVSKLDTFYYKSVNLTEEQANQLELQVISKLTNKIPSDSISGFDGIHISYILQQDNNLAYFTFWSPDSIKNIEALRISQSLVDNVRAIFKDLIINEYCDDLDTYLCKTKTNDSTIIERRIDKLRKIHLRTSLR